MSSILEGSRYQSYVYGYPHKTAYRRIEPALPLGPLWAQELRRDALFLYFHIPFCEQRCGFCNLFTQPVPEDDRVDAYLATLARQVHVVRRALDEGGDFAIARAAIGGGTPTLLDAKQLDRLFTLVEHMGYRGAPMSVETSPETALPDRIGVVVERGADRVSIGVPSFLDAEVKAVNRPQQVHDVHRALRTIRDARAKTLNIDLMYGLPGQTEQTWEHSLRSALEYKPEELYLYPLYVRPLTTLGKKQVEALDAHRVALYGQAGDLLRAAGYRQISMRMWKRGDAPSANGVAYCCQADGMVGLGCGARSYTQAVHYSSEWAVGARGVRGIIDRWITRTDDEFAVADYGFVLDKTEQRRRWLILSLLSDEGLDLAAYRARFAGEPDALDELAARGWVEQDAQTLRLTAEGLARADMIGPYLYTDEVNQRMSTFELT